ncbi:hypothetical protein DFP72DRAFT_851163 [Ephemerocybe angulata]|uniref:Uncharacterized protein n=1 Tax=Ephemerocybe angulata TaxID=980116 RepID=A0A8H6HPQ5_9AGAR|nr:hypothetical protein DFP72DRAFT_851163 [Tulosesus angulatus]
MLNPVNGLSGERDLIGGQTMLSSQLGISEMSRRWQAVSSLSYSDSTLIAVNECFKLDRNPNIVVMIASRDKIPPSSVGYLDNCALAYSHGCGGVKTGRGRELGTLLGVKRRSSEWAFKEMCPDIWTLYHCDHISRRFHTKLHTSLRGMGLLGQSWLEWSKLVIISSLIIPRHKYEVILASEAVALCLIIEILDIPLAIFGEWNDSCMDDFVHETENTDDLMFLKAGLVDEGERLKQDDASEEGEGRLDSTGRRRRAKEYSTPWIPDAPERDERRELKAIFRRDGAASLFTHSSSRRPRPPSRSPLPSRFCIGTLRVFLQVLDGFEVLGGIVPPLPERARVGMGEKDREVRGSGGARKRVDSDAIVYTQGSGVGDIDGGGDLGSCASYLSDSLAKMQIQSRNSATPLNGESGQPV